MRTFCSSAAVRITAAVVLWLVVAELGYGQLYHRVRHGVSYYELDRRNAANRLYVEDPDVGYRSAPNLRRFADTPSLPSAPRRHGAAVQTNEHGFRDDRALPSPKAPGEIRVFALGDSTTYGLGRNRDTYPGRLQHLFADTPSVRIVNAGVPGYRSIHQVRLYATVIRALEPDVIIVNAGIGDFEAFVDRFWAPGDPSRHHFHVQIHTLSSPLSRLAIGEIVAHAYFSWRVATDGREAGRTADIRALRLRRFEAAARDRRWSDEVETNLQRLITLAKADGVLPVLMVGAMPQFAGASDDVKALADRDLHMDGRWDAYVVALDQLHARVRTLAARNAIPLIDAQAVFARDIADYRERLALFMDRVHPLEDGDRRVAAAMYPGLRAAVETVQKKRMRYPAKP